MTMLLSGSFFGSLILSARLRRTHPLFMLLSIQKFQATLLLVYFLFRWTPPIFKLRGLRRKPNSLLRPPAAGHASHPSAIVLI
ncbi:hypothetical protein B0H11DRAFT_2083509, partial [Mycena galericulata]